MTAVPTPEMFTVRRATYAEAHLIYRRAGWHGPLPLPAGAKWPPPDGFTGWHGADPSGADSQAWIDDYPEYRNTTQLALRMPADVIGIDVDHYGSKRGGDTIAEAERRWGPLPPAPRSSARPDPRSGIRFYKVPAGLALRTQIKFPELGLGDVEIIQRHHRYAVVWPSVHPTEGAPYVWYDTAGPDVPPLADRLYELPEAWVEALRGADEPGEAAADPDTVRAFSREHTAAERPAAIAGVVTVFRKAAQHGSRHDAMVAAACMGAREARAGLYPAADVRAALRQEFTLALAEARQGQRLAGPAEARREFESIWAWAVGQALAEPDPRAALAPSAQQSAPPPPSGGPGNFFGLADEAPAANVGAAQASPGQTVTAQVSPPPGGQLDEHGEDEFDEWENRVRSQLEKLLIQEEARRRKDALTRDPLAVLDLDEFLDAPQPDYLFPRAIYRNGTAKIFGPPGGTKSFFVLDMALSLASGAEWHGMRLEPAGVHYVMAEGQATNTARALAWFHHRGIPREAARGRFKAIPQGVLLTPEGIEGYLEIVKADQPALIILDTKNRMMVGEENSGSDSAVLIRAMDALRQAAGGAAVVLIDHTGISDTSRSRGSNAIEAAMDTELRVMRDEGGLATAEVTRDKAAEPGATWTYRIERVEGVPGLRPGTPPPATVVPTDGVPAGSPLALARATWWDVDQPPIPEEIARCGEKGAEAARDIFRILRFVNDPEGIERARIVEALREGPRPHGKSTVTAALALMVRKGWVEKPSTGKYALEARFYDE